MGEVLEFGRGIKIVNGPSVIVQVSNLVIEGDDWLGMASEVQHLALLVRLNEITIVPGTTITLRLRPSPPVLPPAPPLPEKPKIVVSNPKIGLWSWVLKLFHRAPKLRGV
jgi:hypothetical protein